MIADDTGVDLARRRDGRRDHRGLGVHSRRAVRGGALGPGDGRPHRRAGTSCQRGGQALRARRRPGSSAPVAVERAVELLVEYGGGTADDRVLDVDAVAPPGAHRASTADLPSRVAGVAYPAERVADAAERDRLRRGRRPAPAPRGHAADLAARPHRPGRPGRGGDPAGRVRPGARACCRSPRPARGLTASQRRRRSGRPGAGRGRATSRCCRYPFVGAGSRSTRSACRADDPRREARAAGQPAVGGGAGAAHHAAAAAARHAAAQHRARAAGTWRCSRSAWCSIPAESDDAAPARPLGRRPAPDRRGARRGRHAACRTSRGTSPPCSPARSSRPAGGVRAGRPTGPTRSRPPASCRRRRRRRRSRCGRGRVRAVAPGPVRRARRSTAPWSGTPASCTRPSAPRSTCPGAPARWS